MLRKLYKFDSNVIVNNAFIDSNKIFSPLVINPPWDFKCACRNDTLTSRWNRAFVAVTDRYTSHLLYENKLTDLPYFNSQTNQTFEELRPLAERHWLQFLLAEGG